ncbi:MAG: hypothetical protein ACQGVC_19215 [Myxococcota bacterium]
MTEPSIKGMTLMAVVEDVKRLRDDGRISDGQLTAALEPLELGWLEEKIQPALWYPIGGYERLTQLLLRSEGRGDPGYLVRRGETVARRLIESGMYAQLRHGDQRREEARAGGRPVDEHDGRLMTTLASSIFNFGAWRFRQEGDHAVIEGADVEPMPDVSVLAARGLIAAIASHVRDAPVEVTSERPERGRVLFRYPST